MEVVTIQGLDYYLEEEEENKEEEEEYCPFFGYLPLPKVRF